MFAIDHLGIAVRSLEQSKQFYEKLGDEVANAPAGVDSAPFAFFAPPATLTQDSPSL